MNSRKQLENSRGINYLNVLADMLIIRKLKMDVLGLNLILTHIAVNPKSTEFSVIYSWWVSEDVIQQSYC